MKPITITILSKPAFGAPCNGCGHCCIASLCPAGEAAFGKQPGPCPALEYEHGRAWCGLYRNLKRYFPDAKNVEKVKDKIADRNGFGWGCGMEDYDPFDDSDDWQDWRALWVVAGEFESEFWVGHNNKLFNPDTMQTLLSSFATYGVVVDRT